MTAHRPPPCNRDPHAARRDLVRHRVPVVLHRQAPVRGGARATSRTATHVEVTLALYELSPRHAGRLRTARGRRARRAQGHAARRRSQQMFAQVTARRRGRGAHATTSTPSLPPTRSTRTAWCTSPDRRRGSGRRVSRRCSARTSSTAPAVDDDEVLVRPRRRGRARRGRASGPRSPGATAPTRCAADEDEAARSGSPACRSSSSTGASGCPARSPPSCSTQLLDAGVVGGGAVTRPRGPAPRSSTTVRRARARSPRATSPPLAALNDAAVARGQRRSAPTGLAGARPGCDLALVAPDDGGAPLGFLLAVAPGADYASENYRWFSRAPPGSLYVDRVVVAPPRTAAASGAPCTTPSSRAPASSGWAR